jgi:hypothetical protein
VAASLDNVFSSMKIYRWWATTVAEGTESSISVPVRLTDESQSIAMAERAFGEGRVVAWSFPADLDWSDWPAHPSYAPVFFDLVHDLARRDRHRAATVVGGSWTYPVDLSRFDTQVSLIDPSGEAREATAAPADASTASAETVLYQVRFDELARRGVYTMRLRRPSGEDQRIQFAVNLEPSESNLQRIDLAAIGPEAWGSRTKVVTLSALETQVISGGHNEIWPQVLIFLAAILGLEQVLGWWFGRRR